MKAMKIVPTPVETLSGDARAVAVRKFRELADLLESGELQGARVQWRDGLDRIEYVEMTDQDVRFRVQKVEE